MEGGEVGGDRTVADGRFDGGDDLVEGGHHLVGADAGEDPVVGLVGVGDDGGPHLGVEVDARRGGPVGQLRDDSCEPGESGGGRKGVELGLGQVGVAAVGGDHEVGFAAGRLIAQSGAGGGVLDEGAAAVDGEQGHDVEETHAQAAGEDGAGLGHEVDGLLDGVARADPREVGGVRRFGEGSLGGGGSGWLPAVGEDGGVGGDGGAVGKLEDVTAGDLGDAGDPGVVVEDPDAVGQLGQGDVVDPAQVGTVEGAGRVGLGDGDGEFLGEGGGDGGCGRVGVVKRDRGGGDAVAVAAEQTDPLVEDRALEDGCGDGGTGFGEQGDGAGEGVHAQGAGLVGVPHAAGAVLGGVDEVEREAAVGGQGGGDAFDDRDAAGAEADDGHRRAGRGGEGGMGQRCSCHGDDDTVDINRLDGLPVGYQPV